MSERRRAMDNFAIQRCGRRRVCKRENGAVAELQALLTDLVCGGPTDHMTHCAYTLSADNACTCGADAARKYLAREGE